MQATGIPESILTVNYDSEEDALYVNLGTMPCGHLVQSTEGLLLRRIDADSPPNGITAMSYKENWLKRLPELYSAVATYLDVPPEDVQRAAEAMTDVKDQSHGRV